MIIWFQNAVYLFLTIETKKGCKCGGGALPKVDVSRRTSLIWETVIINNYCEVYNDFYHYHD